MEIEYNINRQDYLDFNLFHTKYSETIRKAIFKNRYIISLSYFIFPLFALITDIPAWYWLILSILTYVIWILVYPKYYEYKLNKIVSKILSEDKNNILGDKSISLEEEGIIASDISSESKTNWSGIVSIEETENHIFIFKSSVSAYIIPIRAFINKDEKENFMSILKSNTVKV